MDLIFFMDLIFLYLSLFPFHDLSVLAENYCYDVPQYGLGAVLAHNAAVCEQGSVTYFY